MQDHRAQLIWRGWKRAFPSIVVLLLCTAAHAQETCPVEIKLLLSPSTIKSVIASLGFGKQTSNQIYFFDTPNRSLLNQGVIVRVRQGAKNDLAVKVRLHEGDHKIESSKLRDDFGCEIDRTEAGANTTYSVGQSYELRDVPNDGDELFNALSSRQLELLKKAHVSVPWSQVRRISGISSTTWTTRSESPSGKLTLEYWEFPGGTILELSAKSSASEWELKNADLQRIVKLKGLSLSPDQETKTSTVLRPLKRDAQAPD
jgi:hypothetical protein